MKSKNSILFLLISTLALLATTSAYSVQYADTFYVTVADKTPEHPHYNEGYSQGYVVNGLQSPTITLVRDSLYLFDTHEVPRNLVFYFYTIPIGGTQGEYTKHVEDHILSTDTWIVKASDETPDTLYYASTRQPWMGGMILIVDSITSGVEEGKATHTLSRLAEAVAYPNPFVDETELRFVLESRSDVRLEVVDALGRLVRVEDAGMMEAGERTLRLRVESLTAGIYLYRIEVLSEGKRSVATGNVQVIR